MLNQKGRLYVMSSRI